MASSTSSTSTTKNNNYNYFNNRLQNHWMFLKTRHLNWIWLPLSDRSSAIGKTENNIMINPFLLHLFAKPFSISLGSRLYPLPFDIYISLSPSVFASFIPPTNCTTYLFLNFPAKNKSSSIYTVALLDYYLIGAFVKDAPRCSATPTKLPCGLVDGEARGRWNFAFLLVHHHPFKRLKRKSVFAFQSFNIQQSIVVTCPYQHLLRPRLLHPQKRQTSQRQQPRLCRILSNLCLVLSSSTSVWNIKFPSLRTGENPREQISECL